MSVKAMSWVWTSSRSKPTQRLVLLAIADCANDRGAEAYPATSTLAEKTGLTDRGVRKAITELEELGELRVEYKTGPRGTNRYRVVMRDPEQDAGSDATRNQVPGSRNGIPGTGNDVPGTRNGVHPVPHSEDPEPGSADPEPHSEDPERGSPEPSEPSGNHQEPSSRQRRPRAPKPEPERPEVEELCRHLADRVEANGSRRPKIGKRWRDACRLMIDRDGRPPEKIRRAIDWCQDDEFWRGNVMSMPKLREKYDQLRLAAQRKPRASPNGTASGQNRHVDDLPPEERENRNPFAGATRSSQAAGNLP